MTYAELSREQRKLVAMEPDGNVSENKYWEAEEAFKAKMRIVLADEALLRSLNKRPLLRVLAWCSKYRPIAPHAVLSTFSKLAD